MEEEFLRPMGVTQIVLANRLRGSLAKVNELIAGKRGFISRSAYSCLGTSAPKENLNSWRILLLRSPS